MPRGAKGELGLVGYDGETIAFVEIRTRTVRDDNISGLPELSVGYAKQSILVRSAQRFLADCHLHDCPTRFDVLAIDNIPGHPSGNQAAQSRLQPAIARLQIICWRFVALNGDTIRTANRSVSYLCLATKAVQFSNSVSSGQRCFACVRALSLSN
jgi:Holliday junction resolvase-like predicted endonuclease